MRVLRAFSEDDERLTAAELGVRTGLPRSTAHRLAAEMMALGMLDRLPDGAYTIGTGLWEVGELAPVSAAAAGARAAAHAEALRGERGERAHRRAQQRGPGSGGGALRRPR